MVDRMKFGPEFKTECHSHNPVDNSLNISTVVFHTKSENDHYAKGLALMGETKFFKYYYNPNIGEWFRYHNDQEEVDRNAEWIQGRPEPLRKSRPVPRVQGRKPPR
jgi:hypothetical protein